jgi:hypothetical protein
MKKEAEYKQHALECHRLAEKMERGEQREQPSEDGRGLGEAGAGPKRNEVR